VCLSAYNICDTDIVVRIDPNYFRPTEVEELLGDATKAYKQLGWKATCLFDVNVLFLDIVNEPLLTDFSNF